MRHVCKRVEKMVSPSESRYVLQAKKKGNGERVGAEAETALRRGQSRACFQRFLQEIALSTHVVSSTEIPCMSKT